jgi:hypothetical protein
VCWGDWQVEGLAFLAGLDEELPDIVQTRLAHVGR